MCQLKQRDPTKQTAAAQRLRLWMLPNTDSRGKKVLHKLPQNRENIAQLLMRPAESWEQNLTRTSHEGKVQGDFIQSQRWKIPKWYMNSPLSIWVYSGNAWSVEHYKIKQFWELPSSLVVRTAKGLSSIPGLGIKIPQTRQHGQTNKNKPSSDAIPCVNGLTEQRGKNHPPSQQCRKASDTLPTSIDDKNSQELGTEGNLLNLVSGG